jgi:Putative regulator of cell autolysis
MMLAWSNIDRKESVSLLGIHFLLWIGIYLFMGFLNHLTLYEVEFSNKINLLTNLVFLIVIILNHYLLIPKIITSVRNWKWEVGIFFGLLLYVCSTLISNFPLYYIAKAFPDTRYYRITYEYYGIKSWEEVFSYKPLLWTFTCVFFWNFVSMLVQATINLYQSQKEKLAMLQERNNMELNFLRMQIQPHFLFNTLNNIYGMVLDNQRAADSVTKLSELLRFSLGGSKREWVSLQEEILFLTNYIDLERIRHRPEKVQIKCTFSASAAEKQKIKPLLLVNFIENAFKHGVNANVGTSWVDIQLTADEKSIWFYVANSRPLTVDNKHNNVRAQDRGRQDEYSGIGLENVRRRLELEYFEKNVLSIKQTDDCYIVELTLLF